MSGLCLFQNLNPAVRIPRATVLACVGFGARAKGTSGAVHAALYETEK